jgi:hypothetical protein
MVRTAYLNMARAGNRTTPWRVGCSFATRFPEKSQSQKGQGLGIGESCYKTNRRRVEKRDMKESDLSNLLCYPAGGTAISRQEGCL